MYMCTRKCLPNAPIHPSIVYRYVFLNLENSKTTYSHPKTPIQVRTKNTHTYQFQKRVDSEFNAPLAHPRKSSKDI